MEEDKSKSFGFIGNTLCKKHEVKTEPKRWTVSGHMGTFPLSFPSALRNNTITVYIEIRKYIRDFTVNLQGRIPNKVLKREH